MRAMKGSAMLRQQAPRRDHRAAGGLGVVDEALAVEEREVERLAAGGADARPGVADVVLVLGAHGRRVAGAQAAHHHAAAQATLEAFGERRDHRREAIAPRAHGVGEVDEALLGHGFIRS